MIVNVLDGDRIGTVFKDEVVVFPRGRVGFLISRNDSPLGSSYMLLDSHDYWICRQRDNTIYLWRNHSENSIEFKLVPVT